MNLSLCFTDSVNRKHCFENKISAFKFTVSPPPLKRAAAGQVWLGINFRILYDTPSVITIMIREPGNYNGIRKQNHGEQEDIAALVVTTAASLCKYAEEEAEDDKDVGQILWISTTRRVIKWFHKSNATREWNSSTCFPVESPSCQLAGRVWLGEGNFIRDPPT